MSVECPPFKLEKLTFVQVPEKLPDTSDWHISRPRFHKELDSSIRACASNPCTRILSAVPIRTGERHNALSV